MQQSTDQGRIIDPNSIRLLESGLDWLDAAARQRLGEGWYGKVALTISVDNGKLTHYKESIERTAK